MQAEVVTSKIFISQPLAQVIQQFLEGRILFTQAAKQGPLGHVEHKCGLGLAWLTMPAFFYLVKIAGIMLTPLTRGGMSLAQAGQ